MRVCHVRRTGIRRGGQSYTARGAVEATRDTDHDGRIGDAERRAADRRGDKATAIMFHPGGSSAPISAGCQTMAPDEYDRFVRAMGASPPGGFSYTLVDGR